MSKNLNKMRDRVIEALRTITGLRSSIEDLQIATQDIYFNLWEEHYKILHSMLLLKQRKLLDNWNPVKPFPLKLADVPTNVRRHWLAFMRLERLKKKSLPSRSYVIAIRQELTQKMLGRKLDLRTHLDCPSRSQIKPLKVGKYGKKTRVKQRS